MGFFSRKERKATAVDAVDVGGNARSVEAAAPFTGEHDGPPIWPAPGERLLSDVPAWLERFGDIPGLAVVVPQAGDRSLLLGCGERPWIYVGSGLLDDEEFHQLMWPGTVGFGDWQPSVDGFGHDWSPVQRFGFGMERSADRNATTVLAELWPMLERPGTALDYHFLLQVEVEALWKRRDEDPEARDAIIRIGGLDRALVSAQPETLLAGADEGDGYLIDQALERLAAVFEQVGDLEAAFEVTEFAAQFGQMDSRRRRLAKKLGRPVEA